MHVQFYMCTHVIAAAFEKRAQMYGYSAINCMALTIVRDPTSKLAVFPEALPAFAFGCSDNTNAMLLVCDPLSLVRSAIRPCEGPLAVFLAGQEFTLIVASIGPIHCPNAVHVVLLPFT